MKLFAIMLLNKFVNKFDKKVYSFRPLTFRGLLEIKINIIIQWAIQSALEFKVRKSALETTRRSFNSRKNKIALVMGNGPSLNSFDLGRFDMLRRRDSIDIFTVNYAILDRKIQDMNPTFIVLSDDKTVPSYNLPQTQELWKIILNRRLQIVSPISWHCKFEELQSCFSGKCLHFVDASLEGISFSTSPLRARGYSSMTAYKALAFAVHLGYSKIFCAGIDNSNFKSISVNGQNRIIQSARHFTQTYGTPADITDYYPNGICDYLADYSSLFGSLRFCFAKYEIYNLAEHSEVDAFQKISADDLNALLANFS